MFRRVRRSLRDASQVDKRLVRRSAELPETTVDRALKSLTRSANKGVLWFTVASVLALRKGRTRRAALRGVVAIGFASASANLVGKQLFPRRRPAAELLPTYRRLTKRPTSSSFPSGHSASAVAFTTALAMESPALGLVIAPVAAAVAYSRVHTGVHWPTDVAAGAAIGVAAGLVTRRWWPTGADVPASAHPHSSLPAIEEGEGLLVMANPGSGADGVDPTEEIAKYWPKATVLHPEDDLIEQLHKAIDDAVPRPAALGVAGGDGTVAAVAAVAAERHLPLVLVPAGTLNHFARDVGVDGIESVSAALKAGDGARVDLSHVDIDGGASRWFVNTASLGGYPDMVRLREKLTKRWGKWPAGAMALVRVLSKSMPLQMVINNESHLVWMLFVGNGTYQPKGFAPTARPELDSGLMDVRYIRADVRFSRLRFVLGAIMGALHRSRTYQHLEVRALDVTIQGRPIRIATDGEVGPLGNRFRFRATPAALGVYR
ncbi:undecaprenyl-diphosphatase [Kibdelosporangium banguiense]|uniref:Undecaprenyl-diphosphatase n=1 Tax=Kibdelosporangium banguiense TaxID=1365924 RepID=A0ABS4TMN0_9PSEU|nr:bifunctional phosphatase PAP2/diacylglycerol kinase family protein [Kibdelosporangium banguiense]MBP2325669.1 undecaprenyl-diphosphatase [Kibdelosporangium banguiense]